MGVIVVTVECGDESIAFPIPFEDEPPDVAQQTQLLDLDVKQAAAAKRVENIRKTGNGFAASGVKLFQLTVGEITDAAMAIGRPVDGVIVNDDDGSVPTSANVHLQTIRATMKSIVEGSHRIFAVTRKTGSASVPEYDHGMKLPNVICLPPRRQ